VCSNSPFVLYFKRWLGKTRPIPWSVPPFAFAPRNYITGFVGAFVSLSLLGLYDAYASEPILVKVLFVLWRFKIDETKKHHRAMIFSFGATAVLLYAAPDSPLSQPRNVMAGNIMACVIGLLCRYITIAVPSLRWFAGALAVSCSIVVMQLTKARYIYFLFGEEI
jgi:hypothetical protein